jgi:hypothetical protein
VIWCGIQHLCDTSVDSRFNAFKAASSRQPQLEEHYRDETHDLHVPHLPVYVTVLSSVIMMPSALFLL